VQSFLLSCGRGVFQSFYHIFANKFLPYRWIKRVENATNNNGTKTIQESCFGHRPFWYSLRPKSANNVTAINPYERFFFCFSAEAFIIDQRLIALNVEDGYDVELISALLNSVVTFLTMEMKGTSRSLGALDLNANYFKKLKILNPDLLTNEQRAQIKEAFIPIKQREIKTIFKEVRMADRINFDRIVLQSYGIEEEVLNSLYSILIASVNHRVNMADR